MRLAWTILGFVAVTSLTTQAQVQCPLTQPQIAKLKNLDWQIAVRSQEFQGLLAAENVLKAELEKTSMRQHANTDFLNAQLNLLLEKGSVSYAELANLQMSRDQLEDSYCRQNRQHIEADVRPDLKSHPRSRVQR